MTLSKYNIDFSDSMALKLRLNGEVWHSSDRAEVPASKEQETISTATNAPYDLSAEILNLVTKHPGLTPEVAKQGLKELGF